MPEGFCFVLFCGDSERRSRDREQAAFVHDRGFAAHCRHKTKTKNPLAPRVFGALQVIKVVRPWSAAKPETRSERKCTIRLSWCFYWHTIESKYRLQRGIYQLKLKSAALCSMEKLKLYCSDRGTELARSAFDRWDEMICLFLGTFPSRAKNCSGSYLLFHFSVQETRETISSSQCRLFLEGS